MQAVIAKKIGKEVQGSTVSRKARTKAPPSQRITAGLWLSIAAFVLSLVGGGMVVLGQFFAPKSIETKLAVIDERQKALEWRVDAVRVNQENGAAQLQALNVNMARLLGRFSVKAVAVAPMIEAPAAPPDSIPMGGE